METFLTDWEIFGNQNNKIMRKRNSDNKFFMPSQIEVGTPEKKATDALETPQPLAKGSDGLPRFNQLNQGQKKNMPKALRTQVAYQQKRLQYSNYQIINFKFIPSSVTGSVTFFYAEYNQAVAVGTAMTDGVLFGSGTKSSDKAKYFNIVYANARCSQTADTNITVEAPSFIEFYLMRKVGGGVFGGKIPRQIEAVKDETNLVSLTASGDEYGVQSFGLDLYNENAYYTQSPDLKGMRCCGIALKELVLNFGSAVRQTKIEVEVEIGIDLKTEGNNY